MHHDHTRRTKNLADAGRIKIKGNEHDKINRYDNDSKFHSDDFLCKYGVRYAPILIGRELITRFIKYRYFVLGTNIIK